MRSFLFVSALLVCTLRAEEKLPDGYVMQVLEPTGGKILRPEGWFYHEVRGTQSWTWTISKEDTHGGKDPYDTGVRIQTIPGVQKATGKTPEAFVRDFIGTKRTSAEKIHKTCEPVDQGMFTRICIEVTEGEFRILYSAFWGNDMDVVVVSTSGAKTADWEANAKFFDTMSSFELIDMERFPDKGK